MQCEVSSYSPLFSIRLAYNQAGGREGMGGGVGRDEREGMGEKGWEVLQLGFFTKAPSN